MDGWLVQVGEGEGREDRRSNLLGEEVSVNIGK